MAPKGLIENPPLASSSEDDEVSSQEEDLVEDHDDEQEAVVGRGNEDSDDGKESEDDEEEKYTVKASTLTHETSDSEAETNSCPLSPSAASFTIKSISSKPTDVEPKKSKQKSQPKSDKNVVESPQRKKAVIGDGNMEDVKKGSVGQRLWSEEDVIVVLEGMGNYKAMKGADPNADTAAFYEFIKKSLHVSVTKNQLVSKIRSLKKKYQNNMKKGENGEDPVFSNPHEDKSFELSKKIWGVEVSNDNTSDVVKRAKSKQDAKQSGSASDDRDAQVLGCAEKRKGDELLNELVYKKDPVNGRIKKKVKVEVSGEDVNGFVNVSVKKEENDEVSGHGKFSFPSLAIDWYDLGRGIDKGIFWDMGMIDSVKARELNEKWKQLLIDELELFVQRTEVFNKHAVAVLEVMKKSSFP